MKTRKILSVVLAMCMILSILPITNAFAAISYADNYDGEKSKNLSGSADGYSGSLNNNIPGFAGKKADDVVYEYVATKTNSGYRYIGLSTNYVTESRVLEFNILLPDSTSSLTVSPALFNTTGYKYYLDNGKIADDKTRRVSFDSLFNFSKSGVKITDNTSATYFNFAKSYNKKYLDHDADGNTVGVDASKNPLTVGEWHTVSIKFPGLVNGVGAPTYDEAGNVVEGVYKGGEECLITIDGVEYVIPFKTEFFGTRHIKIYGSGLIYLDNLNSYYTKHLTNEADYKNTAMVASIESSSEDVTIEDNIIKIEEGLTATELKDILSGANDIRIYTDSTYETLVEGSDLVKAGNIIVAAANNGDTIERSYNYYTIMYENESDFEIEINADGKTCTVTGFKADKKPTAHAYSLTIPEKIAGYTVTEIGENAFRYYDGKTENADKYLKYVPDEVELPDTVKVIGKYAFGYCYGINISKWPNALEVVKSNAFDNAKTNKIGSINYSASILGDFTNTKLKTLEASAFSCSGLKSIVFPDSLTSIGKLALNWCNVANLVIPDSVTTMGDQVLSTTYSSINNVRFPRNDTFKEIPAQTFYPSSYSARNNYLFGSVSLYIPETITTFSDELLRNFKDGATVTIYGKKPSAAYDYYLRIKGMLTPTEENPYGTYFNNATYPYVVYKDDGKTVNWSNPEDYDGDGKGRLKAIKFVEYDFDYNTVVVDSKNLNTGDNVNGAVSLNTSTDGSLEVSQPGIGGKLASDNIIKLTTTTGDSGHDFINLGNDPFFEASMLAAGEEFSSGVYLIYYNDETLSTDKGKRTTIQKLAVVNSNNTITVNGMHTIKVKPNTWHNVAVQTPEVGGKVLTVYIDGVAYPVELTDPYYGTNRSGICVNNYGKGVASTAYLDNLRATSNSYTPLRDILPTISTESEAFAIENDLITFAEYTNEVTVKDLIDSLTASTEANIRVYKDNTYKELLADDAKIKNGNMVVVAAYNGYEVERAYAYYDVTMPAPPVITTAAITVSTNGADVLASVNGGEETSFGQTKTESYEYGTEISLKAVAGEGQEFMYWREIIEGSDASVVVSENEEYSFIVGSAKKLMAMFADAEVYTVSFRSSGRIVADGVLETVPQDPYMAGYTFVGWHKFGGGATELKAGEPIGELTENVIYQAAFKKEDTTYEVKVVNAENEEALTKQYNDKVSVVAADVEGMNFAYWERDGKPVSYNKEYSFYVSAATTIKAVYTAEAVQTPDVVVTLATPAVVAGNKLAYYAERNINPALTVIETGILLNQTADFDINTAQIKAVAKQTTHQGQFTVRKANVTSDQTWYGKAYVIYKDAEGVTQFVYSEMVGPSTVE